MKFCLCFFLCLTIYFRLSYTYKEDSSVDNGSECVILSPARCPKTCECKKDITMNPKSWYQAFIQSLKGGCKCDDCRKPKKVKCKHGVCDTRNKICACQYCWVGEVCDKFKNKHAPEFKSSPVQVSLSGSHPLYIPITAVTATDRDAEFCNGIKCPCGDVVYKMQEKHDFFTVDENTGAISMIKPLESKHYSFTISAGNILDGEITRENTVVVNVDVMDTSKKGDGDGDGSMHSHHRVRRGMLNAKVSPLLVISAKPVLNSQYYFNKGEQINFTMSARYNGSTGPLTKITMKAVSSALTIIASEKGNFSSGSNGMFTAQTLNQDETLVGTVRTIVKDSIGPLENLNLDLDATFTFDGEDLMTKAKSSPILYAVYPEVNLTRQSVSANTYDDVDVQLSMKLPLLNYRLIVELTTNVECFVFMEIKDVSVDIGSLITNTFTAPVNHTSEHSNGLIDRVVIDFGNITVSDGVTESNYITIKYKIGVKDHVNVANGSTHYAGAGLQAGPSVLWVKQQNITITKIEPALEVTVTPIDNSTQLHIGDRINITYKVEHASTSEEAAKHVNITLVSSSGFLRLVDLSEAIEENTTFFRYKNPIADLPKGKSESSVFQMEVKNDITPLTSVPVQLLVHYQNKDGVTKFPLKVDVPIPLTGTPSFSFNRTDGHGPIVFGNKVSFMLTIQLNKMRSPLRVEIVLPKVHENETRNQTGEPLMHITSFTVMSIGNNLKDDAGQTLSIPSKPKFYQTSSDKLSNDQAVWNLTTATSTVDDTIDPSNNQIKLKVDALVNEVKNLANGTTLKVGVGVIGLPRMVWIGQLNTTVLIKSDRQPDINFTHTITNETKDEYEHHIQFSHTNTSDQYAYNVTFEYYLPPYVQYIRDIESSPGIEKVDENNPRRARFRIPKPLTFLDSAYHGIKVKLNRSLSPKTGKFTFMVPCALTYINYEYKKWQYWRSVTREINVGVRTPVIEKKNGANPNYYGRGIYVHNSSEIYVCMNMHLPTARPACYRSADAGTTWFAMDSRVGAVIGRNDEDGHLYAVGRNQIVVIKYDETDKDWYLLNEKQKTALQNFFDKKPFNDFTNVDSLEPEEIDDVDMDTSKKWGATAEWLYYRPDNNPNSQWEKKAKWRL